MKYTDEYVDALEKEVIAMRKFEKHTTDLLKQFSFRRDHKVHFRFTDEPVLDPNLAYVLNQLYTDKRRLKNFLEDLGADEAELPQYSGVQEQIPAKDPFKFKLMKGLK